MAAPHGEILTTCSARRGAVAVCPLILRACPVLPTRPSGHLLSAFGCRSNDQNLWMALGGVT